ncbi:MAG: formylglycine-generating enzyme family protein [Planctomycetota bacterium]
MDARALLPLALVCAAVAGCGGDAPPPSAEPPAGATPEAEVAELPPQTSARPAPFPPPGFRIFGPAPADGELPRELVHERTGLELVLVPAGSFQLGSTPADPWHAVDEAPARRVEMSAFYIARTEVTQAAWERGGGEGGRAAGPEHPLVEISWKEADAWCRANGLALPSEAQWEYAASGPGDRIFPWGDAEELWRCNSLGTKGPDRWDETAPVASFGKGASWSRAYDLAGNVAEWCRDPWRESYLDLPAGRDPERTGDAGDARVLRGGAYSCRRPYCVRTAYRDGLDPDERGANLGFRVALDAPR